MASDFTKPDKIHTLYKSEIESKMWKLPVSELFMIGRKSIPKLNNMRIKTIGDLAKYEKLLQRDEETAKILGNDKKANADATQIKKNFFSI